MVSMQLDRFFDDAIEARAADNLVSLWNVLSLVKRLDALGYKPKEQVEFITQNLQRIADNFKTYMNI